MDKYFYSKESLLESKIFMTETKKFNYFNPNNLKKTGLGSSACVVVNLVS